MSRVIKFRAWDKERKKMVTPCDGDFIKWHAPSNWIDFYEVMQFTGLTDCNGVEIYEGDVCCIVQDRRFASKVCFHNGEFTFADYMGGAVINRATQNIEVIGNIYEHPHLLDRPSESP